MVIDNSFITGIMMKDFVEDIIVYVIDKSMKINLSWYWNNGRCYSKHIEEVDKALGYEINIHCNQ